MTIKKIMSATPSEFFRSLAHFAPERQFDHQAHSFKFPCGEGEAAVSYKVIADRQVTGLLKLPQLEVSLSFSGSSDVDQQEFIDDFDLAFRRGGG